MSSATNEGIRIREKVKLPMADLLALFTAGFLGIINETITAIPLNAVMKNWGRRTVLVSALVAFIMANAAAALVSSFTIISSHVSLPAPERD